MSSIKGKWLRWQLEQCLEQHHCGRVMVEAEVDGVLAKHSDGCLFCGVEVIVLVVESGGGSMVEAGGLKVVWWLSSGM